MITISAKGDVEVIGIVLLFYFCTILLLAIGSVLQAQQFTETVTEVQTSQLDKYEAYATTASLIQNKSLLEDLEVYTYDSSDDLKEKINNSVDNSIEYGYSLNLEDSSGNQLSLSDGSTNLLVSRIIIASPRREQQRMNLGVSTE